MMAAGRDENKDKKKKMSLWLRSFFQFPFFLDLSETKVTKTSNKS